MFRSELMPPLPKDGEYIYMYITCVHVRRSILNYTFTFTMYNVCCNLQY